MNRKSRRVLLVLYAAVMALGIQALPSAAYFGVQNQAYAATGVVSATVNESPSAVQGEEDVSVTIDVVNGKSEPFTFDNAILEMDPADNIYISGGMTGSVELKAGESMTLTFLVSVGKNASTGSRDMTMTLEDESGDDIYTKHLGLFKVYTKTSGSGGNYTASLDISQSISPESGLASGQDNTLTVTLKNIGNTVIKNAVLTLTLPDGLSIDNASNSYNIGYINTGSSRNISFPIAVEDGASSKNYQITAAITGLDYNNDSVSVDQVLYVPVVGSGATIGNLEVTGINLPDEVSGSDPFKLSFNVHNNSNAAVKNAKIAVEVPEGLLNQTRNTFIAASIAAGESKNYEVKLFADDSAKEKAYTIKISLSSSTASDSSADTITEYASVYVNGASGEKTPQLMVDNYNYGGTFVQAGDDFLLELGLLNTSSKSISNIKVTVTSEDGSIIPANSSNSFFIEKLGKKERTDQAMMLSVKPAAEQKTTPLNVEMSYEDGSGNAFTSKDVISIPVMQETRLEVDDIIAPPELYAGMQGGVSVQFYNMGKTTLNNLRVTAEGDFDTPESTSYFVGNMESGKSDTYDFMFIPRQGGTMEGKVVFTYEDAAGDQQVLERPFSFEVMAEMPAFDEGIPPEDGAGDTGGHKKLWIALGVIAVLAAGGIIAWRKIRKRKMHREMEIDE